MAVSTVIVEYRILCVLTRRRQRGMTMAPRIQVYTDIACRAFQEPLSRASDECTALPEVQARAAGLQARM